MNKEKEFKGKKVLVVGMGRSGLAAAEALMDQGAVITLQDSKENCVDDKTLERYKAYGIRCCFGAKPDDAETYDVVVISPGVPKELDFVQKAVSNGAELIGELENIHSDHWNERQDNNDDSCRRNIQSVRQEDRSRRQHRDPGSFEGDRRC